MENLNRKPNLRRAPSSVRQKPSITAQAGIPQADAPRFSPEILKALNLVLGTR